MKRFITTFFLLLIAHASHTTKVTFTILAQYPHLSKTFLNRPCEITTSTTENVYDVFNTITEDERYDNNKYYVSKVLIKQSNEYYPLDSDQTIQQHIDNKRISLELHPVLKIVKLPHNPSSIKPAKK